MICKLIFHIETKKQCKRRWQLHQKQPMFFLWCLFLQETRGEGYHWSLFTKKGTIIFILPTSQSLEERINQEWKIKGFDLLNWLDPFISPFVHSDKVLFIKSCTGILPSCFKLSKKILKQNMDKTKITGKWYLKILHQTTCSWHIRIFFPIT